MIPAVFFVAFMRAQIAATFDVNTSVSTQVGPPLLIDVTRQLVY